MPDQPNGVSRDANDASLDRNPETTAIENGMATPKEEPGTDTGVNGHRTPPAESYATPLSPRGLKRKLSHTPTADKDKIKKAPSPPWKKFEADRPTSFVEEGRRRSGRTNVVPLEAQPQSGKRQTRAAYHHSNEGRQRSLSSTIENRQKASQDIAKPHVTFKKPAPKPRSVTRNEPRQNRSLPSRQAPKSPSSQQQKPQLHSSPIFPGIARSQRLRRRSSETLSAKKEEQPLNLKKPPPQPSPGRVRSLRLNFRRPPLPMFNPGNIVPNKKYGSFQECLDQNEPLAEDGERPYTPAQVREEALMLQRLERAAAPGGALSGDSWYTDDPVDQAEPTLGRTHPDFLFTHVHMFWKALQSEHTRHVREARVLAHAAAQAVNERWRKNKPKQPKTEEQLRREEAQRLRNAYRPAMKELQHKWIVISNVARQRKLALHEKEQEAMTKQALGEMLERSSKALETRKKRRPSRLGSHGELAEAESSLVSEDGGGSSLEGEYSSGDDENTSDGEDSTSSSDEESDDAGPGSDDELTLEEIKQKYAQRSTSAEKDQEFDELSMDELDKDEADTGDLGIDEPGMDEAENANTSDLDITMGGIDPSQHEIEEVADALLDSENEETDSDSGTEESESEESDGGSEGSDGSAEASEDDGPGLLGFFSAAARKPWADSATAQNITSEATQVTEGSGKDSKRDAPEGPGVQATSEANSSSEEISGHGTPATTVTSRHSEREAAAAVSSDNTEYEETQNATGSYAQDIKTEVPSLLRGQLREYQHYGLDWLAGMYDSETNGILADEMGLGKTIQTIALLAHLATEKGVWGPHLIVVPTSVMLNWEMEFKKWCPGFKILTYYGTIEERKAKRKGWLDNDLWHVCITSYQLALQDQNSLKKRNWHYMVLDEAHNIKNFRSQRWQTLLSFKTQARLLLTGTPLQNNLTELWSLLFFLSPEIDEEGNSKFADLKTFSTMFRHPVEQILDHGREAMDDEARDVVNKLHQVLRPHLLRRLKAEVEKQMPKKYEHVVKCRLSKRQRQLYDGYMGLAGTRESFATGNYMSIINCLMQLRKVCNHPDLFEERQIVTSYAMPRSAIADYEIKDLLIRRGLFNGTSSSKDSTELLNLWRPNRITLDAIRAPRLAALKPLEALIQREFGRLEDNNAIGLDNTLQSSIHALGNAARKSQLFETQTQLQLTAQRTQRRPVYSSSLLERLSFITWPPLESQSRPMDGAKLTARYLNSSTALEDMFTLRPAFSESTDTAVQKFGCVTPAVIAPGMPQMVLTKSGVNLVRELHPQAEPNPFHVSQTRLSVAFPDKSLIQYDCGKLQQLDRLLRDLQSGGHRALIFTQMTRVLDILEQFMNLHGHRYLRLDGSTKVEQRQALTDQFNRDTRILAFILSSRSGGLGINLTGADTVIFYDLDWNPAMDKQCQDRCHRIGQTRDVHIYRFVSEGTIEANILRKSNQKRMLDDVVIQEGEFTTDVFNRESGDEFSAEADAALDKVLGGSGSGEERRQAPQALEQAEDKEDRDAAIQAQKEDVQTDANDFEGKPVSAGTNTPDARFGGSPAPAVTADQTPTTEADQTDENEPGSYEEYMLRFMEWELQDVVIKPFDRSKKKKKGKDQGIRIRR